MDSIVLVKQGTDEPIAFACGACKRVVSSNATHGTIEEARAEADAHCAPRTCETCGAPTGSAYRTVCNACMFAAADKREEELFARATKLDPESYDGMIYDPSGRLGDEGFCASFADAVDAADDAENDGQARPAYVYACTPHGFGSLDADEIVDQHLESEEHHEDARDQVVDVDELRAFLKAWSAKQTLRSWAPDYSRALVIPAREGNG